MSEEIEHIEAEVPETDDVSVITEDLDEDRSDAPFNVFEFFENEQPNAPEVSTSEESTEEPVEAPEQPEKQQPAAAQPATPATPATPAQPAAAPMAQPETAPTEQDLNAQFTEWFKQGVERLSTEVYALPDELKEQLDNRPSEVLPRIAAELHMRVMTAVTTLTANMLPSMVPQILESTNAADSAETAFFNRWPRLKDKRNEVARYAQMYRSLNPNASAEDAIEEVGVMASVGLRIPLEEPKAAPVKQAAKPARPTGARGAPTVSRATADPSPFAKFLED